MTISICLTLYKSINLIVFYVYIICVLNCKKLLKNYEQRRVIKNPRSRKPGMD